ncbi:MAG: gamma-glutamyltransferase [Burkholderiaceae bacterium]|nr:gamma-glutamyltransferase [Burkholderiaceae bacterium]
MRCVLGERAAPVGTPGVLCGMLELAHRQQAVPCIAQLFEPAIRLAENGFAISAAAHACWRAEFDCVC